jgi:hypothetical protein
MENAMQRLDRETEDMHNIKDIVDRVISYKEEILSVPLEQRNALQELWLLAFEASEAKIAKMGVDQTEDSRLEFSKSMFVLNNSISSEILNHP